MDSCFYRAPIPGRLNVDPSLYKHVLPSLSFHLGESRDATLFEEVKINQIPENSKVQKKGKCDTC